jgi:hypothetical protein
MSTFDKISDHVQQMKDAALKRYLEAFSNDEYEAAIDGYSKEYQDKLLNQAAALSGSPGVVVDQRFIETVDDDALRFLVLFCRGA